MLHLELLFEPTVNGTKVNQSLFSMPVDKLPIIGQKCQHLRPVVLSYKWDFKTLKDLGKHIIHQMYLFKMRLNFCNPFYDGKRA